MPEFILSTRNLSTIATKINTFLEDQMVDMICLKELKPIEALERLEAKSTYGELVIENDAQRFLSRKARHKPFRAWGDRGLFAQIGDFISFTETSIVCIHNGKITRMPRKMTILRIHPFVKKVIPEIPGVIGKKPGGGPRPQDETISDFQAH